MWRAHSPKQMELQMKTTATHTHTEGEIRAARSPKNTTCAAGIIPLKVKPREHRSTSHKKL